MLISNIELIPIVTRRHEHHPSAHVIVRIETDAGITGYGEMPDLSHAPAIMPDVGDLELCLNDLLRGRRPQNVTEINKVLNAVFPGTRFGGKSSLVRCGVDIAVWDILGKATNQPVCDLIGGHSRQGVPICYPIFRMKRMDDIDSNLEVVAGRLAQGFDCFRLYVGADPDVDEAFMDRFQRRFGDRARIVAIDASGLLSVKEAIGLWKRLHPYGFDLYESPVNRYDVEGLAEVRRSVSSPISEHIHSEEYAFRLIKEERAVDIFNVSVSVAGGITAARRLLDLADMAGLACLIGTTQETSIATAAQAHVGASCPRLDYHSDPVGPLLYIDDVAKERVRFVDGQMLVPEGAGLGIEVDEAVLEELRKPLSSRGDIDAGFLRG
ncbi:MAG: mandelate racemase/muconate lactonizing enzyme family protein [Firmicutes bacterium]|jgi:muconate cycloisomerase|nr:mandelate racemase/muconate lactonizing enzyme family protein [Bacillota bacterium]